MPVKQQTPTQRQEK